MPRLTKIGLGAVALWFTIFGLASIEIFPPTLEKFLLARIIPLTALSLGIFLAALASTQRRLDIEVSELVRVQGENSAQLQRLERARSDESDRR